MHLFIPSVGFFQPSNAPKRRHFDSIVYSTSSDGEEVPVNRIANCTSNQLMCWFFSKAAVDDIVQGRSTDREEAQVSRIPFHSYSSFNDLLILPKIILDSINRNICIREQEKARLLLQVAQLGNTLGTEQAARTGPTSEILPSAVDELEWSLLLCDIRAFDLPDITNFHLPRASSIRTRGLSFVTDELKRLCLLYNPAASGSTSTSTASNSTGQLLSPTPITTTSTASSPGYLSSAAPAGPPFRQYT